MQERKEVIKLDVLTLFFMGDKKKKSVKRRNVHLGRVVSVYVMLNSFFS